MAIEEERFRYIHNNQKKLRAGLFWAVDGCQSAIVRGDSDCLIVQKTIILPWSHTGGLCYRAQNYQDAMAICRWAGYLDLFLTFSCNSKWLEINEMQCLIGQDNDGNRVDIIYRVFQIKLFQLMQHLEKQKPFGKIVACKLASQPTSLFTYGHICAGIYTIEFLKRGLAHAHILLFLHETLKNLSADHIDRVI